MMPARLQDQEPTLIKDLRPRTRSVVQGRIVAITYPKQSDAMTLRAHLKDESGTLILAWPGRRDLPGVHVGVRMIVEGAIMNQQFEQLLWNPHFQILEADVSER